VIGPPISSVTTETPVAMFWATYSGVAPHEPESKPEMYSLSISKPKTGPPSDVVTAPYPGFPTDLQPPFVAYLSLAKGTALVEETIFDARFVYVSELARMGADIKVSGRSAVVKGVEKLKDAVVEAPDIRAGGALVLAALAAEGTSEIGGLEYLDRGYEYLEDRLSGLGASIARASVVAPVGLRVDIGVTAQLPKIVTPYRSA